MDKIQMQLPAEVAESDPKIDRLANIVWDRSALGHAAGEFCPECSAPVGRTSACLGCPVCGWSRCG